MIGAEGTSAWTRHWARGVLVLASGLVATSSCSFESLTDAETDVVFTLEDQGRDYPRDATYVLPDRLVDLCPRSSETDAVLDFGAAGAGGAAPIAEPWRCLPVDHRQDQTVIERLRSRLDELGYREVEQPSEGSPDLAVFAGIVARDEWFVAPGYPFCDPLPYFPGCWYPDSSTPYAVRSGSLLVYLVDVNQSADGDFQVAWTFAAQGLLSREGEAVTQAEVEQAIDQAFEQSPYLVQGGR